MAPLSVLPGRMRFEARSLVGSKEGCLLLEESISSLPGVSEVSASHRTGRLLVRFDETLVCRSEIEALLGRTLRRVAVHKESGGSPPQVRRTPPTRGASTSGVGHFLMEMALHALLPAPLDLLLPTAATVFRR